MSPNEIGFIIEQAQLGLNTNLATCEGDCGSIAVAIQELFDGEFVGVTKEPDSEIPSHVAVRIDDAVYDGDGRTSLESLATIGMFVPESCRAEDLSRHFWSAESIPPYMVDEQKVELTKEQIEKELNL